MAANVQMSQEDQARLKAAGDAWGVAHAAGDEAGMKAAHADAELVRAKYDYSGGADGSQYIPLRAGAAGKASNRSEYDLSDQIKKQAAASLTAELAGLKGAYEKSMLGYDAAAERLPAQYQQAKNRAAVQNAQEKRAFDERAAAAGLSSGANAQAQLAASSVYQGELAALDRERAEGLSDIELQKAQLKAEYQDAILQAKSASSAQQASDLYKEMIRLQGIQREDEQTAALWARQDQQLKDEWGREDAQTAQKEKNAERDYARQLALAYELVKPEDIGKINSLADLAALSASTQGAPTAGGKPVVGGAKPLAEGSPVTEEGVPAAVLERVQTITNQDELATYLNGLEAARVISPETAVALYATYLPKDAFPAIANRQWSIESDGGLNWGWGIDNNAMVVDQYGNKFRLDQLVGALVGEGMSEADATAYVKNLQKRLGI